MSNFLILVSILLFLGFAPKAHSEELDKPCETNKVAKHFIFHEYHIYLCEPNKPFVDPLPLIWTEAFKGNQRLTREELNSMIKKVAEEKP